MVLAKKKNFLREITGVRTELFCQGNSFPEFLDRWERDRFFIKMKEREIKMRGNHQGCLFVPLKRGHLFRLDTYSSWGVSLEEVS